MSESPASPERVVRLRFWHRPELAGMLLILLGLFAQLAITSEIEERRAETDAQILASRLEHIYQMAKSKTEVAHPKWEEIENFWAGPKVRHDSSWRFETVEQFLKLIAAIAFVVGSILSLVGKYFEHLHSVQQESE